MGTMGNEGSRSLRDTLEKVLLHWKPTKCDEGKRKREKVKEDWTENKSQMRYKDGAVR